MQIIFQKPLNKSKRKEKEKKKKEKGGGGGGRKKVESRGRVTEKFTNMGWFEIFFIKEFGNGFSLRFKF